MESLRQQSTKRCAEDGCDSSALNGTLCLRHQAERRIARGSAAHLAAGSSGRAPSRPSVVQNPSQNVGRVSHDDQSRSSQSHSRGRDFRDEPAHAFQGAHATVRRTNLPPDLMGKLAMTARKTAGAKAPPKKRMEEETHPRFHTTSAQTHTPESVSPINHETLPPGTFNPFRPLLNQVHSPSQDQTKRLSSSTDTNQRISQTSATVEQVQPRGNKTWGYNSARASSGGYRPGQSSRASQVSAMMPGTKNASHAARDSSTRPDAESNRSQLGGRTSIAPSASTLSGNRSFDSLPHVSTKSLPPMHVKSAPSALRSASTSRFTSSAGKRRRLDSTDTTSESSSSFSSSDEDLDDDDDEIDDRAPEQAKVVIGHPHSSTYLGAPATLNASQSTSSLGLPGANLEASRSRSSRNEDTTRLGAVFRPIVLSSSSDEDEDGRREKDGRIRQPKLANGQSHNHVLLPNGTLRQGSTLGRADPQNRYQQDSKSSSSRKTKRLTCEERRLQLCADFEFTKFDAMIYSQPGATRPPLGVYTLAATIETSKGASTPGADDGRFHMKLDPRIHWPHNRSDQWYKSKMEEIKARGGRKANFGKAAKRMRQQRLAEERQEEEDNLASARGEPRPWSHHRHMDFGDVPEEELPIYVRRNEEWVRGAAWMRKIHEESQRRDARRAAELFKEHLASNGR
ncbi:hypothetical protein CPAR01_03911 [Colletotrichum paranaense]|uniref:Uncharacterized protein n=1 Tax=Colletotrichum paranaense TaxID=1914294 RepID=A0ABQ9SUV8_9PEZI|nr:uncharacterized protein CPAR01_03911 [Colletotrichum paranaense]KAK1543278.1 hypothetical protein CPAR01_03911 [Colletotrichum paranaense]